ncbi:CPBP family intramembrane metalloprotease [Natronolimnobius sp. AArcel1]|uniref:CPBP family intramembrane glutamic endopeptidase n=1 Tax=Natronolimnobius sp. AArcel1 TaxID=1679093 RepID=UPI0013EC5BBD|nr:type II CAAX endopeptidase family protein [Natronolimnobius sp. AArcel1]NGM70031.1 CPBP family intramembrane metalloprotease [Natronolimnobius sp. AArcel1]
MTDIDRTRLGLFIGTVTVLMAGWFVGTPLLIDQWDETLHPAFFGRIHMFTPMVAALVVCFVSGISLSTVGLRLGRVRWLGIAVGVAFSLVVLAIPVAVAVPGIDFQPTIYHYELPFPSLLPEIPPDALTVGTAVGIVVVTGVTIYAVFGFGEEFGWRGYLLWELAPLGFWRASVIIGIVWGLWHAPVAFSTWGMGVIDGWPLLAWLLTGIVFSPVYTYVVIRAKSVLAAALFHGVFNATTSLFSAVVYTDEFMLGTILQPVGVAGLVTFGGAVAIIAVRGPPELTREFAHSPRSSQNRTTPTTDTDA